MAGIAKNKEEEFKVFGRVYESFMNHLMAFAVYSGKCVEAV
ncbi:MAG: hypothetical protein Q4D78_06585 [Neisseria zoodegmatis]|nr:hypothetical protein [Neisseria zoodegmatis]MDO5069853.1 hypothetical protein [Neisseria zoodegmatis]